jgi:hypothetical protein
MTNDQYEKAQAANAERNTPEYKIKLAIAVSEEVKISDIEIEKIHGDAVYFKMMTIRYYATTNKRGDGIRKNSIRQNRL